MARGTDRDNPRVPWSLQWLRRTLERLGYTPGSGGGGGSWGSITGTLSDQTDLQTALDGKAAASTVSTNTSNIATNTSAIAGKQDAFTVGAGLDLSGGVLSATGGGGGPGIVLARGTSTDSVANTEVVLTWADPSIDTMGSVFSVTGSTNLRCGTAGTYKFTVQVRTTNSNRAELIVQARLNGTPVADDIVSDYVSRDTDQNTGGVTLTYVATLAVNDTVSFIAEVDADGTSTLMTAGTSVFIEGPY